jgi:hypothetical protein
MAAELTRARLNGHIANTTSAHGISTMTRSLWIPSAFMILDSASATTIGTAPDAIRVAAMADAVTQGVYATFQMPMDAVGGAVTIRPVWSPATTISSSHAVRWQMDIRRLNSGDVTAAGTAIAWTENVAAWTAHYVNKPAGQNSDTVQPAAGDVVRLNLRRLGGDAADTATTSVNLIGIIIEYVAIR